ncbi:hypothetical protein BO71DRAFT_356015 [Aspergillus ellipticus CBS 707.79]|uniref:RING-type domain-containing protein n=1 Tax=Aspergillus ellipticus CBS 707.79 TaxID=1448320 RepID=A0A319D6L5_9EURO|nr:hypothetical protein BO71DRAFT_356015 [Aspergillus ellipticus CBS 707.79]
MSSPTAAPLLQLADILKIELQDDQHCVGTAASYIRRCQNRIRRRNRRHARELLDQGNLFLAQIRGQAQTPAQTPSAASLHPILEQLAPLLLCSRQHRSQAENLVTDWKEKLDHHLTSASTMSDQFHSGPAMPLAPASASAPAAGPHPRFPPALGIAPFGIVDFAQHHPLPMMAANIPATGLATTAASTRSYPAYSHQTTTYNTLQQQALSHQAMLHPANVTNRPLPRPSNLASQVLPPPPQPQQLIPAGYHTFQTLHRQHQAQLQQDLDTMNNLANPPAAMRPAPMHGACPDDKENVLIGPRPVEGDCGICLLPYFDESMRESDHEGEEDDEEGDWEWFEGQDLAPQDYNHALLIWCKACGVNYHRACLEQWLDTFDRLEPTCPTCRKYWA